MKRILLIVLAVLIPHLAKAAAPRVTIVIGENAPALEKRASDDLASDLKQLFAAETATQSTMPGDDSATILVGSPVTNAALKAAIGDTWPKLSDQGHVLRSIKAKGRTALVVGGDSPVTTLWAVHELGYRFGIRHMLHGDYLPVEKPVFTLEGFDVVLEPRAKVRAWNGFTGQPFGAEAWNLDDQKRLIAQLAKLKFTHFVIPEAIKPITSIRVDGDTPGRKAFRGARVFENPDAGTSLVAALMAAAAEAGLIVTTTLDNVADITQGRSESVLPHPNLGVLHACSWQLVEKHGGFAFGRNLPGDLDAGVHYLTRAAFDAELTAETSLTALVTPICGKEVDGRLLKGFTSAAKAGLLIVTKDRDFDLPRPDMIASHLTSNEPPPAWWTEVKTLYTEAMNEMYRGNTRARDGARPFILYHAKRFEFAVHFLTSIEAARKAGNAKAAGNKEAQLEALDQAVEAMHNALNALGDVARDPSDRGVIAVLNEHACRPLIKALEKASNE